MRSSEMRQKCEKRQKRQKRQKCEKNEFWLAWTKMNNLALCQTQQLKTT